MFTAGILWSLLFSGVIMEGRSNPNSISEAALGSTVAEEFASVASG